MMFPHTIISTAPDLTTIYNPVYCIILNGGSDCRKKCAMMLFKWTAMALPKFTALKPQKMCKICLLKINPEFA